MAKPGRLPDFRKMYPEASEEVIEVLKEPVQSNHHSGSDHQPGRKASDPHSYPYRQTVSRSAPGFHDFTGTGTDPGSETAA